jgi:hypothetical protein
MGAVQATRPAAATLTVRVERFAMAKGFDPRKDSVPADAKASESIETLVAGGKYRCVANAGKTRTELSGRVRPMDDAYSINVNFRKSNDEGTQQISSSIVLKPGDRRAIGGLPSPGGEGNLVLFLTLEASDRPGE